MSELRKLGEQAQTREKTQKQSKHVIVKDDTELLRKLEDGLMAIV